MLDSLLATLPDGLEAEVLLVDDGSTDGTRDWLATLRDPRVRALLNEENRGFATTCNRGAAEAKAPLLCFLNNDLLFTPGWLEPMLEALTGPAAAGVGIVGNLQERALDGELDHAGVVMTPLAKLEHLRSLPAQPPAHLKVLAVTGACVLLRRADFEAAGGFDTGYLNGGEDVDLCLRLGRRGLACVVATRSRIVHHVSATRGHVSERDEANSRRLFLRWRTELTQAIASAIDTACPARTVPAERALLLARSAFWREEARWSRLLDEGGQPALALSPQVKAPLRLLPLRGIPLPRPVVLTLPPGKPDTAFTLRVLRPRLPGARALPVAALGVRVSINGIQVREWPDLPPGTHDLAITDPASLPDRPTRIEISALVTPLHKGLPSRLAAPLFRRLVRLRKAWVDGQVAVGG